MGTEVQLRDLCIRITKGTTPTTIGGNFSESGIPFIKVESITESGRLDPNKLAYINAKTDELLARSRIEPGDLLFSIAGSIGRVAMVDRSIPRANTNQAVAIIRPDEKKVSSRYLYFVLRQRNLVTEALSRVVQSVQANFSLGELGSLPIPVPSTSTQDAIAHVLGTLDDKIELLRQTNETLEAMARALFKSWFVDFDPVRKKSEGQPTGLPKEIEDLFPSEFEDSELGEIPKGWRVNSLQMLTSKIGSGATPRGGQSVYTENGVALIRSQNIYDSEFVWDGLARLSDESARQLANVEVNEFDVLINITGASILRTCVVEPSALPARVNQHVAIVRAKSGFPHRFLHETLLLPRTKETLLGLNAGGSREAITKAHLESLRIVCPEEILLKSFERTTSPIYLTLQSNSREISMLGSLRDSLLPRLISGDLDLTEDMIAKILEPAK